MAKNAYARELQRRKAELKAASMEVAQEVKDLALNDVMKMAVIALNEEFGLGNERLRRFAIRLYEVSKEFDALAGDEADFDYAREKMNQRIAQIFGDEPVDFHLRY